MIDFLRDAPRRETTLSIPLGGRGGEVPDWEYMKRAANTKTGRKRKSLGSAQARGTPKTKTKPKTTRQSNSAPLPTDATARDFSKRLRAWFRRHGRDLPWRRTRDPYHILVSELMLQQTQVSRVVDYYARFLSRFPSLTHLAESPQKHVVDAWSGLGYYARARNLHTLARHVTRDGGVIPADPRALRELPGIGAYTAGAVSSFAYERRASLVDTNVARVLARVFAPAYSPKRPRDLTQLWRIADAVLPTRGRDAWTHNQAIMELGALICTARIAHCQRCPVATLCASRQLQPAPDAARETTPNTSPTTTNKNGRKRRRSLPSSR